MINLNQVSQGRENICNRQNPAPSNGISGTNGVLNGRGISGFDLRRNMMAIHTMVNASKVPMETNSPSMLIGSMPARIRATKPVSIVLT
jgi:hypothetical protein